MAESDAVPALRRAVAEDSTAREVMLNAAQMAVLRWIAEGCPEGVMEGYEHRISAAALRTRGLVRVSGRGQTWSAELTPAGKAFLESPPSTQRRMATRGETRARAENGAATVGASKREPEPPAPRSLAPTEQLVADVIAAGGVLRLSPRRAAGEPDYEQRVSSAKRFGKVPPGKRLRTNYVAGELEIRLEDAPPGTEIEPQPVLVPARVSRPHPVAKQFRNRTEYHEVSRAALSRCTRIVHALAIEVERRGYTIANVTKSLDGYRGERWSGSNDGHLVITIRGHSYPLRLFEEKVSLRGDWERERRRRAENHYSHLYYSPGPLRPFDKDATGRLTITLDGGYTREGRPASWADRKRWTLEEKLPDLLRELEIRAVEDDHRAAEAKRAAEERQRRWEAAMERAKERHYRAHLAKELRAQVAAWQEARLIRDYLAVLEETHGGSDGATEWITWIRNYANRVDPLQSAPTMPERPEPTPDELKPFLDGLSPYGPPSF